MLRRPQPETDENIPADGPVSVVWLDRIRKRVGREVGADSRLDMPKQIHIARVADGIRANAECAAIRVEILFDFRLIARTTRLCPPARRGR